jgi:uncharacterized protein YlxW (UPF0749 family)
MSPASYLTAPPRVAATRIASFSVPWWTWIALVFFAVVVAAGGAIAIVSLLRMRRARTTADELRAAVDELTRKTEELEARLEHAAERAEFVERKVAKLEASLERLGVLRWALGDFTKAISQVRSAVAIRK